MVKIEFGWRGEVVLALVIAAVSGALFGGFLNYGYSYGPELSLLRHDLTVQNGSIVSARSLQGEMGESWGFPPPLYVWEWFDFEVRVSGVSGTLEINFTRNGEVLKEELVAGSAQLVLSGYGEYNLVHSQADVKLRAVAAADVTIGSLYVAASSGVRQYNPLVSAFGFTFSVGLLMIPFIWRRTVNNSVSSDQRESLLQD